MLFTFAAVVPLFAPPAVGLPEPQVFNIEEQFVGDPATVLELEFQQFDGDLAQVLVCFTTNVKTGVGMEHTGNGTKGATLVVMATAGLVGPGVRAATSVVHGTSQALGDFDGVVDFEGSSGYAEAWEDGETHEVVVADPTPYQGDGTVTLQFVGQGLHEFTGPGNAVFLPMASAAARVTVFYFPRRRR